MRLIINGEPRDLSGVSTVASLVERLELKADRLAIELNREIVTRSDWEQTQLQDGDQLEIVHFVGGGSRCPSANHRETVLFAPSAGRDKDQPVAATTSLRKKSTHK